MNDAELRRWVTAILAGMETVSVAMQIFWLRIPDLRRVMWMRDSGIRHPFLLQKKLEPVFSVGMEALLHV